MVNLKSVREARGLSQAKLADVVGCSQQAIHDYERGRSVPSAHTLLKIADELAEDPWYLMGLDQLPREQYRLPPEWREAVNKLRAKGFTPEEILEVAELLLRRRPETRG